MARGVRARPFGSNQGRDRRVGRETEESVDPGSHGARSSCPPGRSARTSRGSARSSRTPCPVTDEMSSKPWRTRQSVTARWPPPRSAVESGLLEGGARHERLARRLLVVVFGKRVAAARAPWATLVPWGSTVGARGAARPSWYRTREPSTSGRVFSPGPWTLPKRKIPGLTWTPPGGLVPRLDLVPGRVLRGFYAPVIDRWAHMWMWRHGGFEVLVAERRRGERDPGDPDGPASRSADS
jgi:hypothetical protein